MAHARPRLTREIGAKLTIKLIGAVPEIPVADIGAALGYYKDRLGFRLDWGDEKADIVGVSKQDCRLFLTSPAFRAPYGTSGPVVIWLNLNSRQAVDELHEKWSNGHACVVSAPESKPWKLHEFTAADLDGNMLRVFYDFAWEIGDR